MVLPHTYKKKNKIEQLIQDLAEWFDTDLEDCKDKSGKLNTGRVLDSYEFQVGYYLRIGGKRLNLAEFVSFMKEYDYI